MSTPHYSYWQAKLRPWLQKFGFLTPLLFSGRTLATTVTAVDILGSAVDSCMATALEFVLLHLISLEPRNLSQ